MRNRSSGRLRFIGQWLKNPRQTASVTPSSPELAAAMLEDKAFSERVAAAVERIHHAQGELQKLTIEHIFDMQTVLTPQQAEKLNKLAADALIQNP